MLNILDIITDWIKGILRDCIMGNLDGMFDQINSEVGEVAANVGTTPAAWNAGVFSMIRNLSDNVVVPIAQYFPSPAWLCDQLQRWRGAFVLRERHYPLWSCARPTRRRYARPLPTPGAG